MAALLGSAEGFRFDVEGAQLTVAKLSVRAGHGALEFSPVLLLVADRLVEGGDGANLGQLRADCKQHKAESNEDSQGDQPNGLHMALVVAEVVANEESHGHPASDLDGLRGQFRPAPLGGRHISLGNTVVDLGCVILSAHNKLLDTG